MAERGRGRAAIVDYGLGNLFSVRQACEGAGLDPRITSSREEILDADLVMLPGVGAFGDAMDSLRRLGLIGAIREVAGSGTPLVGICLGLQLLMTESEEFGVHPGLGIVAGRVVPFERPQGPAGALKVPQVGWNAIARAATKRAGPADAWEGSPLDGLRDGEYMYFVHSLYAVPDDPSTVLSLSRYGDVEFCSSLRLGSVFAFQFHPERSGPQGLAVYRNIAALVSPREPVTEARHA